MGVDKSRVPSSTGPAVVAAPVALAVGFAFGFALEKGQVYLPSVIVNQMLMRDFTSELENFLKNKDADQSLLTNLVFSGFRCSDEDVLVGGRGF